MPGINAAGRTAQCSRDLLPGLHGFSAAPSAVGPAPALCPEPPEQRPTLTTSGFVPSAAQREQGRHVTAGCSLQRVRGEDSRAGAGAAPKPHPLVKGYMQVQFEVPAQKLASCGTVRTYHFAVM
jgi:hypothetical protein